MYIEWIAERALAGDYEYSSHAEIEREADKISLADVEYALLHGEILEDYPEDPRGPSCLVLGFGRSGYPMHIVCGMTPSDALRIITVYIPSLPKWINERTRNRKNA